MPVVRRNRAHDFGWLGVLEVSSYAAPLGLAVLRRLTQGSLRSPLGYDMPPLRGWLTDDE